MPNDKMNSNSAKSKAKAKTKVSVKKPKQRAPGVGLTQNERAYAALLADPCNAPYGMGSIFQGTKGIVQRFDAQYTIATTAGATSGYFIFIPSCGSIATADLAAGNTASTINYGAPTVPGYNYLNTNAGSVRGIAACIEVMTLASQANVVGVISSGNVPVQAITQGSSVTVDGMAQIAQITARVASDKSAVRWVPAAGDQWYSLLGTTTDAAACNACFVAFTGLTPTTGLRVKVTWVVEWTPKVNLGITHDPTAVSPNNVGSLDKVLGALKNHDNNWWYNAGQYAKYAYDAAKNVYSAYRGFNTIGRGALMLM